MELDDGPLMKIHATSEEVAAVESVIAYYLDYIRQLPAITKEEKETETLLKRLQQRLAHPTEKYEDGLPVL